MSKTTYMPFLAAFREQLLSGAKTVTTRTRAYGKAGDYFIAFGSVFRLYLVEKSSIYAVANTLYYVEGFDSPKAFRECWKRIHPETGYRPTLRVWVHYFERVETDTKE